MAPLVLFLMAIVLALAIELNADIICLRITEALFFIFLVKLKKNIVKEIYTRKKKKTKRREENNLNI